MAPSEGKAINIGQGALAGAAVLGVGALAYYGAGLSGEMGAAEKSVMWPQYVKDRIRDTYMYLEAQCWPLQGPLLQPSELQP